MIANFSRVVAARGGDVAPFFLGVGLHKPHLPWYVPQKYYDMYTLSELPLPPNPFVPINLPFEAFDPSAFRSTAWRCCLRLSDLRACAGGEIRSYNDTGMGVEGPDGWHPAKYTPGQPYNPGFGPMFGVEM